MFFLPQVSSDPFALPREDITGAELVDLLEEKPCIDAVAVTLDGKLQDLSSPLPRRATVLFISKASPDGREILRHTAAHVLAQAVKELYPATQIAIGPVIEDGFYYDFDPLMPFHPEDLAILEQRMKEIVLRNEPMVRHEWSREKALGFFLGQGESYKAEIIDSVPEDQPISVYQQGDFFDLCRGPHLPSTGALGTHFCLTKISGSYWRGDSRGKPLQRIYGTAWENQEALEAYLHRIQEAEKRDHRRVGHAMDLFHFQEEAPGSVFWHPHGWTVYRELQAYMGRLLKAHGYQEVNTPQLMAQSLWEASGHWQMFSKNMYSVVHEDQALALKPMNCPGHIQIFNATLKSYRDLPLRMAEFGRCIRAEPSGARSGLMRVSGFTQDDAHIFCTLDQVIEETTAFCKLLLSVYHTLDFQDLLVRFSTRPEERLGSDEIWDRAEESLANGAKAADLSYTLFPGEGAFYGPKLEFVLKDSLGRLWQCGTLQLDFILPQRLHAFYVGPDGKKHVPVMIHRAIFGSFERFIGILIEHTGGHLPLWLAPVQAVVMNVSEKSAAYAHRIAGLLRSLSVRVEVDGRNEKIGYKIREHAIRKVPYALIVGEKEAAAETIMVRHREQQESLSLEALLSRLGQEIVAPDGGGKT